jgi:hypothetical protein
MPHRLGESALTANNPFVFEWPVDQDGYDVVHEEPARSPNATFLSQGEVTAGATALDHYRQGAAGYYVIRRRGGPLRYYRPLDDEPGLWRRFSETCISIDGVLSFVREFGLLINATNDDGREVGDSPEAILRTAAYIQHITVLLDASDRRAAAAAITEYPPRFDGLLRWNHRTGRIETILTPINLQAALLQQAAETLAHGHQWRRCGNEACPEWFRVGTGAATARREYCSNRCRVAASRRRVAPDQRATTAGEKR